MTSSTLPTGPDVIIIMTDQERAAPPYETDELRDWRTRTMPARRWFEEHAVSFTRHYTGSLACVPSRPTLFTGHYPDVHGVTQTDGLGKDADDTRLRWLREGEVPTLGHWFRAAGYDTHYDGKWHLSHADLIDDDHTSIATNDDAGVIDEAAVQAYLDADPLDPYGFSGWVGPEPHGGQLANSGTRRDPLIAARVAAWLQDRYARRRAGDADAQRPFLLVASFVNPHDIVLVPAWSRNGAPIEPGPADPPPVPPSPTDDEDLSSKPRAQAAYREAYPTGYGPRDTIEAIYADNEQWYRDLYHRLHVEVDAPIDQVRTMIEGDAVIVRTSDHGELLGAHGGLHQKWFSLYDEATRVPFEVARVGATPTAPRQVDAVTSHLDLVPTLLGAAGIDAAAVADELRQRFSEVHPLPGRNLMPIVDGDEPADADRTVYLMTRDNILEGDTGASAIGRALGMTVDTPPNLRIEVPADVGSNFEGVVGRVAEADAAGGDGHLWKLARTFDDPATWTEPAVRHLTSSGPDGDSFRSAPVDDEWELYDLTADPIEAVNRWNDPEASAVFGLLRERLAAERSRCVPARNEPWPYATRVGPTFTT
ncbi:MAG: sulfatase-like hydrolase/transferase [Ilumatobacteraceae bacterium]